MWLVGETGKLDEGEACGWQARRRRWTRERHVVGGQNRIGEQQEDAGKRTIHGSSMDQTDDQDIHSKRPLSLFS